jgi:hypothetical protein
LTERGWPRRGNPVLPRLLRERWNHELLPEAVAQRLGIEGGLALGELDASFWDRVIESAGIELTAKYLVSLVTNRLYLAELTSTGGDNQLIDVPFICCLPATPERVSSLPWTARTMNSLKRAGRLEDMAWLRKASYQDLLSVRGFGARALLEFSTGLEGDAAITTTETTAMTETMTTTEEGDGSLGAPDSERDGVRQRLEVMATRFPLAGILVSDPRIRHSWSQLPTGVYEAARHASDVKEFLAIVVEHSRTRGEVSRADAVIDELDEALARFCSLHLDEALIDLLDLVVPEKHRDSLAARLGWDGRGGATLARAAEVSGVSRERVRQIQNRAEKELRGIAFFPQLEAAVELLDEAAVVYEQDVPMLLFREGVTSRPFLPYGVTSAATLMGGEVRFEIKSGGHAVGLPGSTTDGFSTAWKTLSDLNYVLSVAEFCERVREAGDGDISEAATRGWLELREQVIWLDDQHSWFWVEQREGRARYLNIAAKILAVTDPISLSSLREGIMRHLRYRGQSVSLPSQVLAQYLRVCGLNIDESGMVSSPDPISREDVLTENERIMVDVLRRNRNVMVGREFRAECIAAGVNRNSIQTYQSYSPIIQRLQVAIYALRGAEIDPGDVAVLQTQVGLKDGPQIQDSGWTRDGAHWIGYRVTRNIWETRIVSVPSSVRGMLGDLRLPLYATDGQEMGTFAIGEAGNAWGLGPFFTRRGPEIDDTLVVAIDTELGCAVVQSGGSELLEEYAEGDGWGPRRVLEEVTRPEDSN